MLASSILSLLPAALVTVGPGPEDGCPSPAQIQVALGTHAPRLVAVRTDDDPANMLFLNLVSAQPGRELSFSLLDNKGRVRLYRSLPPPPGEKARTCAALADTIAFIVDRFFDEMELPTLPDRRPPPLPPPPTPPFPPSSPVPPPVVKPPVPPAPLAEPRPPKPEPKPEPAAESKPETKLEVKPSPRPEPRTTPKTEPKREAKPGPKSDLAGPPSFILSFGAGRRVPGDPEDLGGIEFKLTLGVDLMGFGNRGGRMWSEVSGGIIGIVTKPWDCQPPGQCKGDASAVRYGGDLTLMFGWPAGRGRLYAGPLAAVEMVWLEWAWSGRIQRETRTGLAAGFRSGYQLFWQRRIFARADLTAAAALIRQRVATRSDTDTAIFATPPGYAVLSFGIGICF